MKLDDRTIFLDLDITVAALATLGWTHEEREQGHIFKNRRPESIGFFVLPKNFPYPRIAMAETLARRGDISAVEFFEAYQRLLPSRGET